MYLYTFTGENGNLSEFTLTGYVCMAFCQKGWNTKIPIMLRLVQVGLCTVTEASNHLSKR